MTWSNMPMMTLWPPGAWPPLSTTPTRRGRLGALVPSVATISMRGVPKVFLNSAFILSDSGACLRVYMRAACVCGCGVSVRAGGRRGVQIRTCFWWPRQRDRVAREGGGWYISYPRLGLKHYPHKILVKHDLHQLQEELAQLACTHNFH